MATYVVKRTDATPVASAQGVTNHPAFGGQPMQMIVRADDEMEARNRAAAEWKIPVARTKAEQV